MAYYVALDGWRTVQLRWPWKLSKQLGTSKPIAFNNDSFPSSTHTGSSSPTDIYQLTMLPLVESSRGENHWLMLVRKENKRNLQQEKTSLIDWGRFLLHMYFIFKANHLPFLGDVSLVLFLCLSFRQSQWTKEVLSHTDQGWWWHCSKLYVSLAKVNIPIYCP